MKSDATWVLGFIVAIAGGYGIATIYRKVPILDRHLERTFMVGSYLAIAIIIFRGVFDNRDCDPGTRCRLIGVLLSDRAWDRQHHALVVSSDRSIRVSAHVIEYFLEDLENFRSGEELIKQTVIWGGDR